MKSAKANLGRMVSIFLLNGVRFKRGEFLMESGCYAIGL